MSSTSARWQKLRRPALYLVIVACAFGAAQLLRQRVGIELSAESIQASVGKLGLWAPVGYVVLVMFRQLMILPSMILLASAGLLFGAPVGAALGGLGITLNAFTLFGTARLLGRDAILPRIHEKFPDFEKRSETAGPWAIALMTAHPLGVLTPFHMAGGVTGISVFRFFLAVGPAALVRATYFAFFGASLLAENTAGIWIASAILVAVAGLPLLHPGLRARLMKNVRSQSTEPTDETPS
jgi:uncharacterized membrane protein YdjX (TVP38/TMEM64 family)